MEEGWEKFKNALGSLLANLGTAIAQQPLFQLAARALNRVADALDRFARLLNKVSGGDNKAMEKVMDVIINVLIPAIPMFENLVVILEKIAKLLGWIKDQHDTGMTVQDWLNGVADDAQRMQSSRVMFQ